MRIRLIGSSFGGDPRAQYATTLLVNDTFAVDCGGLGFWKTPDDQAAIRDVVITHTHADHLATLPIFVENAYLPGRPPVRVWGSEAVIACIRQDLFNDRVYPDFSLLPTPEAPFVTLMPLSEGTPIEIAGVRITPVAVDHTVPTLGMVLESGSSSVVIVSDTGPTERIWEVANRVPNLKAVYLETTFPNDMHELARVSCHLTPALFAREVAKLHRPAQVLVVHLRARFRERVAAELAALGLPHVRIALPDQEETW